MRRIFWSATAAMLVATAFSSTTYVKPAEAMVIYPWCAHYGGRNGGGAPNCGFTTFAQCMATVSGMQGFCDRNPWWVDPPPAKRRSAKRSASWQ